MTQRNLFEEPPAPVRLTLVDAEVELRPRFLGAEEATELFELLVDAVPWRQDRLTLWGREHLVPRLHQWFGDVGLAYAWSGIEMQPLPWIAPLCALRERLRMETGAGFNTVLVNYYRDGADSVGWHADDEPELGLAPVIASVSLGAERDFQLRHRTRKDLPVTTIKLPHGSLLLMSGSTQQHWKHQLPRRKRVSSGRINLTFRIVRAR